MYRWIITCWILITSLLLNAQVVTISPANATGDDLVTLTFDASEGGGELSSASKVYMHHGVVTASPTSTAWEYVIGNWGQDDGVGEMTKVAGTSSQWQITFAPTMRDYFGVPSDEQLFRIAGVFRSADGNTKGSFPQGQYSWGEVAGNGDMFINLATDDYLSITSPTTNPTYTVPGQVVNIKATSSADVTEMKLYWDDGNGYELKKTVTSGRDISAAFFPSASIDLKIRVTAVVNGQPLELNKTIQFVHQLSQTILPLPQGTRPGINYDATDDSKVTLVLQAPGKGFAYVLGDFNNWVSDISYRMNKTPDGAYFWITLDGLTAGQPYVYQYWVDATLNIADPYADQIADPWNDSYIEPSVYPNLPDYDRTDLGIASVFTTGQTDYNWSSNEASWQQPAIDHLVIYELHIRDFLESHSYVDLIDTLDYLERLGVGAIELMPISEFEGNDSWGYNPSFYFAPDKYYGTKDGLKEFIDSAHQRGIAVILDMVLNHSYGQSPFVQLYFDTDSGKPAANNPWMNREYVGQYQWGYDFNHESSYTQELVDRINAYWLEEFHFDGFRFDFTKGFTNYAPNGNIDGFDQSRIDIIERMSDQIWAVDNNAYVILEHWGPYNEEVILADYGCTLWSNRTNDFVQPTIGKSSGSFNDLDRTGWIPYLDSHDEPRIAWHCISEGDQEGVYDIRDPQVMYERVKMAAAFAFLNPGPKMMWQFDELGYDIDINYNGRVGRKPLPWGVTGLGYYEDSLRQYIYKAYQGILDVRNTIDPAKLASATTNHKVTGITRRLSYDVANGIDLVVLANFDVVDASLSGGFPSAGIWYDYFTGDQINLTDANPTITLKPGEWHLYVSEDISPGGLNNVVDIYENPVTINPEVFTANEPITITFDATKASPNGTNGLVDADKVYMQAGVVVDDPTGTTLSHLVGNNIDDGVGEMTEVSTDIWELQLVPEQYFGVPSDEEIYKMGMYFRDAQDINRGYGFRNTIVYEDVESTNPFLQIDPEWFSSNTSITIQFDARVGNRELVGVDKVYMHSSAGIIEDNQPPDFTWNHTVGNWGADDGVGEMTEISDDVWQITLTPEQYYNLAPGDEVYWIAAVFRDVTGGKKGTTNPGFYDWGVVGDNLDNYLVNTLIIGTNEPPIKPLSLFPNPTNGHVQVDLENPATYQLQVFNTQGKLVFFNPSLQQSTINLSYLPAGVYHLVAQSQDDIYQGRLVKE